MKVKVQIVIEQEGDATPIIEAGGTLVASSSYTDPQQRAVRHLPAVVS